VAFIVVGPRPTGGCRTRIAVCCVTASTRDRRASATHRSNALATPNYSYEKRQRELAKKRKAEEKRQKKTQPGGDHGGQDNEASADQAPVDTNTQPPAV
jgi:hypothetical protein